MLSSIKCRKGLVTLYGILVGIYFGGMFPFQLRELMEIQRQADMQQKYYEDYMRHQKHYEETVAYEAILNLQIKSYEKEFLSYETDYIGTERLRTFLSCYPIKNLQVTRQNSRTKYDGVLTLREEVYQITYESTFYESYEIIQNLLRVTGASNLQKVLMTNLDQPMVKSDLTFVLRLEGDKDEGRDKKA